MNHGLRRGDGRRARAASLAWVLACLALGACGSPAGRDRHELILIDRSFQPLRRDFEAARGKVRIVAIVTPTCGNCQSAVRGIEELVLRELPAPGLQAFVVWASHSPKDVEVRARNQAIRSRDPRIRHYWDDSGRIARAFAVQAGMNPGRSIYDIYYLYGREDSWDPGGTMSAEPEGRNALLDGWVPAAPRARFGGFEEVRMPLFDAVRLRDRVRELLAETGS